MRFHSVCGLLVGVSAGRFPPVVPVLTSCSGAVAGRDQARRVLAGSREGRCSGRSRWSPHLWARIKISGQGPLGSRNVGKTSSETEVYFKRREPNPGGAAPFFGAWSGARERLWVPSGQSAYLRCDWIPDWGARGRQSVDCWFD